MHISDADVGSHFYHAHFGLTDQHVFGPLVIYDPKVDDNYSYDGERVVLLSDYWHKSPSTLEAGLNASPFVWVGDASSILTNGKTTMVNCTVNSTEPFDVVEVKPGKTYRFRFIGAMTLGYFHTAIQNHTMTLIEIDGVPIEPIAIDHLEISSGQRYSVLVTMDQGHGDFFIKSSVRWRPTGPTGYSVIRYKGSLNRTLPPSNWTLPSESLDWVFPKVKPIGAKFLTVPNATQTLVFDTTQANVNGFIKWTVNDIVLELPTDKPILQYAYDGNLYDLPPASRPYNISLGTVVDFVIQNRVALNGICENHPWHLHGHTFWDMGGGSGFYTDTNNTGTPLSFPIPRDTVSVYPTQHAYFQSKGIPHAPCGWRRIRFVANNPGMWSFHCHITAHFLIGMGSVILEGTPAQLPIPYCVRPHCQ